MSSPIPILLVNWNGSHDTLECIESVMSTEKIDFKIIVWDNNSTESQKNILKKGIAGNLKVEAHWHKDNIGFTKACNKMMEDVLESSPEVEYLVLLNNDTIVDRNWLAKLYKKAKATNAGMVSSRMLQYYNRNRIDNLGHMLLTNGEILPIGYGKDKSFTNDTNIGASGGAAFYATSMIREIGLFDEFFNTGYEDAEFGLRAYNYGYKLEHSDKAIVFHKGGASIKKVFDEERAIREQVNIQYCVWKNFRNPKRISIFNKIRMLYLAPILILTNNYPTLKILFKSKVKKRQIKSATSNEFKNKTKISKSTLVFDVERLKRVLNSKGTNFIINY